MPTLPAPHISTIMTSRRGVSRQVRVRIGSGVPGVPDTRKILAPVALRRAREELEERYQLNTAGQSFIIVSPHFLPTAKVFTVRSPVSRLRPSGIKSTPRKNQNFSRSMMRKIVCLICCRIQLKRMTRSCQRSMILWARRMFYFSICLHQICLCVS